MIRGTTAQFKFKLPYMFDELDSATITFWQNGNDNPNLPRKRVLDQCSAATNDARCLCVSLEPWETLLFSDKLKARVQLRAQYGGTIFASREQLITVYPINDETIDIDPPAPNEQGWVIFDGEEITS